MLCKKCKNEIPDNAIFCQWCGTRQIKERKKEDAIKVPEPKQLPSGKWSIQLRAEKMRITETTPDLCVAKAMAIRAGFLAKKSQTKNITVAQAITEYISSNKNRWTSPRTAAQYEYIRDHRFVNLMSMSLRNISPDTLNSAVEGELGKTSRYGKPLSRKTVKDACMLVLTVLRAYCPDVRFEVPRIEIQRTFPELLTPAQIFSAVHGTDIELPCLLAMWLSLSISEIRGLTKSKSVRGDKLYIVETVVDVKGKAVRKQGGKEEERPRVLSIPPYIMRLIENVEGDIIEPRSSHAVYSRFQNVLAKAGLPKMRFHLLRHVNASVMAELNIPANISQERGGWKTDTTLKRVYTHTFTEARKSADGKVDDYFNKIVAQNA